MQIIWVHDAMFYYHIGLTYMILLKSACHWSGRSGQEFLLSTLELMSIQNRRVNIIHWWHVYNPQEHPANKNLALNTRMGSGFSTFSKSKAEEKVCKGWRINNTRVNRRQLLKSAMLNQSFIIIIFFLWIFIIIIIPSPSELI